uniref:Uncharacterized protein n=1 Tax=Arundo donax TaxID=35708 RepID=A0A0A9GRV5_ARUDO
MWITTQNYIILATLPAFCNGGWCGSVLPEKEIVWRLHAEYCLVI